MATTSLNIVQRLGGPTLTTVCATFLGWRLAGVQSAGISSAFTMSFFLLCSFHSVLILATRRLPRSLESVERPRLRTAAAQIELMPEYSPCAYFRKIDKPEAMVNATYVRADEPDH
jgi:hypothetical protein